MKVEKCDKAMRPGDGVKVKLHWHDPAEAPFRLAGFAWFAQDRVYRRLPVKPSHPLPEAVNDLANHTAGGQIQFQTNSPRLAVHVELTGRAGMVHMPATGQCGFDCYLGPPGEQRFWGVTTYDMKLATYEHMLIDDLSPVRRRNVTLNFPLYQGVKRVLVGLEPGSRVQAPPRYADRRPVVVYGTSVTQGGCATRPGMVYTNILSRRFNRPFINLGFSGSGKGEPEVARVIAEIANPAALVLDYEANARGELLEQTLPGFIAILRQAHPAVPIAVISRPQHAHENFDEAIREERAARRDFQEQTVLDRRAAGDRQVFFIDGASLVSMDWHETTVDGAHFNDLGFWEMARNLAPVLAKILEA